MELNEMTTEALLTKLHEYRIAHSSLKDKMLTIYDEIRQIEREFNQINGVISKRIKGL